MGGVAGFSKFSLVKCARGCPVLASSSSFQLPPGPRSASSTCSRVGCVTRSTRAPTA